MYNISQLLGIVNSIYFDHDINQSELDCLKNWYYLNKDFSYTSNHKELFSYLEEILFNDGDVYELQKEIKDCCEKILGDKEDFISKSYELKGIIEGIISDDVISESEIYKFNSWIDSNQRFIEESNINKLLNTRIKLPSDSGLEINYDEDKKLILNSLKGALVDFDFNIRLKELKTLVKQNKCIGTQIIGVLDDKDFVRKIHERAEKELLELCGSYSKNAVIDDETVFISLVIIGMMYYKRDFYYGTEDVYSTIYNKYSKADIENSIRSAIKMCCNDSSYSLKSDNKKSWLITKVLSNGIVPSYYLGSFFEFIYDIFKVNFEFNLPDDLYNEFDYFYSGLRNRLNNTVANEDNNEIKFTNKTYFLIKSTKNLILDYNNRDSIIKLSIFVINIINDIMWDNSKREYKRDVRNIYLEQGYKQWLDKVGDLNKLKINASRSTTVYKNKLKFILEDDEIRLDLPVHRFMINSDYRGLEILVKNGEEIIYNDIYPNVRSIIGGYEVKSNDEQIIIDKPLGELRYLVLLNGNILYDSEELLFRDVIAFNKHGNELKNNRRYEGGVVFCSNYDVINKKENTKFELLAKNNTYNLYYSDVKDGDFFIFNNYVYYFSNKSQNILYGVKMENFYIKKSKSVYDVYRSLEKIEFESDMMPDNLYLLINEKKYLLKDLRYIKFRVEERNVFIIDTSFILDGIYDLSIYCANCGGNDILIKSARFSLDTKVAFISKGKDKDYYLIKFRSFILEKVLQRRIYPNRFNEQLIEFKYKGRSYSYIFPLDIDVYRLDRNTWIENCKEIYIDDVKVDSELDIYGLNIDKIFIESDLSIESNDKALCLEIKKIKDNINYKTIDIGLLNNYKNKYRYLKIRCFYKNTVVKEIYCYYSAYLNKENVHINYDINDEKLLVEAYYKGKGEVYLNVEDSYGNIFFKSDFINSGDKIIIDNIIPFEKYNIIFYELKKKRFKKRENELLRVYYSFASTNNCIGRTFKVKNVKLVDREFNNINNKEFNFINTYVKIENEIDPKKRIFRGELYIDQKKGLVKKNFTKLNPVDVCISRNTENKCFEFKITKYGKNILYNVEHNSIINSLEDKSGIEIEWFYMYINKEEK